LVAGAPAYVDIVAQNEITNGLTTQVASTQANWSLSMQAIASAASPTTVAAPSAFEGAAWSGSVVTWSFATGSGSAYNPLSGTVQAQYQEAIEQALQTWANATGLTFQEVPDSKSSDIRIGWEDLDTSTTGMIGSTSIMPIAGVMQPDVEVRLEDPSQDALITGAGGALTYSGTGTTLYQAALHEIGHALGLGPSSDPNSIMFPELGTNNPTLDATDMADLAPLYGATSGLSASALLVQAMASFGGTSPAVATSIPTPPAGTELTIAPAH
jgi:predicted Zn-dependent protease